MTAEVVKSYLFPTIGHFISSLLTDTVTTPLYRFVHVEISTFKQRRWRTHFIIIGSSLRPPPWLIEFNELCGDGVHIFFQLHVFRIFSLEVVFVLTPLFVCLNLFVSAKKTTQTKIYKHLQKILSICGVSIRKETRSYKGRKSTRRSYQHTVVKKRQNLCKTKNT